MRHHISNQPLAYGDINQQVFPDSSIERDSINKDNCNIQIELSPQKVEQKSEHSQLSPIQDKDKEYDKQIQQQNVQETNKEPSETVKKVQFLEEKQLIQPIATQQQLIPAKPTKTDTKPKLQQEIEQVTFGKLISHANSQEKLLMFIGTVSATINGFAFPAFAFIFGEMSDSFGPGNSKDDIVDQAAMNAIWFLVVGVGTFLLSWFQMACWMIAGERQANRLRKKYLEAILNQEIGWFDINNPNELASKISSQTFDVQGGIGEKVATLIMTVCMTIGGFIVGYIRGWELSLVLTAALPAIAFVGFLFTWILQNSHSIQASTYEKAGGRAEQALNGMKTVKSLRGEAFEIQNAHAVSVKYGAYTGITMGVLFLVIFLDYALAFWYGSLLIEEERHNDIYGRAYTLGDVMVIFFSIQIGGFSMGQAAPCVDAIAKAKASGFKIFQVLEREPKIKNKPDAKKLDRLTGEIQLKDVEFTYPAKQDIQVLKKICINIKAGQKTALVGESGCGKSTIMQMIERFYDPDQGVITIDGVEVKDFDLKWLRQNIGYVGQEPVLFAASIRENLLYGKQDASDEEIWSALKSAQACEFVNLLEKKLDTWVGSAGSQLSGGQKQRICIARAILKNPPILLFDEATSALDRANEISIQKTLDQISEGHTSIVIAHRLTTVENADKIIVIDRGQVVEEGTHEELINKGGKYEALAKNQMLQMEQEAFNNIYEFVCQKKGRPVDSKSIDLNTLADALSIMHNAAIKNKKGVFEIMHELVDEQHLEQQNPERLIFELSGFLLELSGKDPTKELQFPELVILSRALSIQQQKLDRQEKGIIVDDDEQEKLLEQELGRLQKDSIDINIVDIRLQKHICDPEIIQKRKKSSVYKENKDKVELLIEKKRKEDDMTEQEKALFEKAQKKKEEQENRKIFSRLFTYNKPEMGYFYQGIFWALINGTGFPICGFLMGEIMWVLAAYTTMPRDQYIEERNMLVYYFLILSFGVLLAFSGFSFFFTKMGEGLTLRLRVDNFTKMIKMPVSWFDQADNNPGQLASSLAADCRMVNQLTSSIIGIQVSNFSALLTGLIISFYHSWMLTLVSLACFPVMMIAGQLQAQFIQGFSDLTDSSYKNSMSLVQEAVTNIRTVASFGNEQTIIDFLGERLKIPEMAIGAKGNKAGLALGFSQFAMFGIYAVTFYVGALFHKYEGLGIRDMFVSIFALMFAGMGAGIFVRIQYNLGNNNQFMGDIGKAYIAARGIFRIIDTKDEYELQADRIPIEKQIKTEKIKGSIEFQDVMFKYPSRDKIVLNGLSFKVEQGQKIAFVGPSGCGKSTVMQILQRFYDIADGRITLDGENLYDYDIQTLRGYFGVVSQEPVLFNGTILENIKYNNIHATQEDIKQAAEKANALKFIEQNNFEILEDLYANNENNDKKEQILGSGFNRSVGSKGSQISGGQKQRIAIARAIFKNPQIMLLDEATSALDSENEKIVQESMDNLMRDKTSITIAHRISTIQDSNQIYVIEDGTLMEQGTYEELRAKRDYFYRLEKGETK